MLKKPVFIFTAILILAVILRCWGLGSIPSGFHADEAAYGYNAYSVMKTGTDEYGRRFPLIFESFGDAKAAVYSYITIPFIAVMGLTETAVRSPSAAFGILFVALMYFFVLHISKDKRLATAAMALSAVSPLGIELSHVQSDPLVCIVFFYCAVYLWFLWTEKQKTVYLMGMAALFILSFLTYTVTRLFVIPFFCLMAVFYWKTYSSVVRRMFLLVSAGLIGCVVLFSVGFAGARFSQINVFSKQDVQLVLDESIREDGLNHIPNIMTRAIHNKPVSYGRYMLRNFSAYLSTDFLFFQAIQPKREEIPDMGVLLLLECPFLLIGIYEAIHKRMRFGIFSICWFLLVPAVLSVISGETPNIHRFFLAALPIHVLVGIGILSLGQTVFHKRKHLYYVCVVALFTVNIGYFLHELFIHQPVHFPYYRGFAYKELVAKMPAYYPKYDSIIVTKGNESPYIYFLFFGAYDPITYQRSGSHRDLDYQGFDKYIFIPSDCPSFNGTTEKNIVGNPEHTLLIRKGGCKYGLNDKAINHIAWNDGAEAFQFVEYQATPDGVLRDVSIPGIH